MITYPNTEYEYARTRLLDTVVLHNSQPVYVRDVGIFRDSNIPMAAITDIYKGTESQVQMSSLDLSPIQLGYVNYKGSLNYVTRVPVRGDYRQGLRHSNMGSTCGIPVERIPWKVVYHTIMGQYPSLDNVMKDLSKKGPQAWHRDWGVEKNHDLIYKGEEVAGFIDVSKGNIPVLHKEYDFLEEFLLEAVEESRSKHAK